MRFSPPEGVAIRGTVIVVVGRGESPAVYPRFGQRLAADGYVVAVPDPASAGFIDGHTAQEVARGTEALVAAVHRERDTPGRVVVVGSDTGAWWALLAAAATSQVAGVVAVGLPLRASHDRLDWDAELEVRTACPVHRARLDDTQTLARDALAVVPEALRTAGSAVTVGVPILVLHGEQDQISPWRDAVALARTWPTARAVTVADGRHDVLNDLAHRSVAAEIVQLLERLRLDPAAPPILLDHP
ncbi:MAG: hypothetical protein EPO13_10305 [Actinomycetota bacterium]|nr:MAG: hypothetical protein EPO13_10305 [Actinomycetota bacterium]